MLSRATRGATFAAVVFLLVQVGALALVPTFDAKGYQQVQNPQDPANSLLYLGIILVMTALMLGAFRFGLDRVVRGVIILTTVLLSWYVVGAFLPALPALGLAVAVGVGLAVYPEWYVIDAAGVLMGAGAAGLFGISFGILPAVLLLAVLAVYDAISVYGTEHMLDLAEGVLDLRVPVVLVIPLSLSYSILREPPTERPDEPADAEDDGDGEQVTDGPDEVGTTAAAPPGTGTPTEAEPNGGSPDGEAEPGTDGDSDVEGHEMAKSGDGHEMAESEEIDERDVFFIGLGDAVMPAVLVASAAHFAPVEGLGLPALPALNLPALGAMVGTLVGLAILLRMVFRGRAHAGLPLLNGGAILGYLVAAVAAGVPLAGALGL